MIHRNRDQHIASPRQHNMCGISDGSWSWFAICTHGGSCLPSVEVVVTPGWVNKNSINLCHVTHHLSLYSCPVNGRFARQFRCCMMRKKSIMTLGTGSLQRHSWRCISLWGWVVVSSGKEVCCACAGLWLFLWILPMHDSQHSSYQHPTVCPGCPVMPPAIHQPAAPRWGTQERAVWGSQASTWAWVTVRSEQHWHVVRGWLEPRLGQEEGCGAASILHEGCLEQSCPPFQLVQKWTPWPQTGHKQPKASRKRVSLWFPAIWGHPSTTGF